LQLTFNKYLYSDLPRMPGQKRLKAGGVKHFFRSLVPGRSNRSTSTSPNRQIVPTLDPQALSTPVGPDPSLIHGIPDTQPLDSPSSNIYPSIVAKPEDADLASTIFQGVKSTLQLVEKVADAFPPLKLTVSGLLGVIDIVGVCDFYCREIVTVLTVQRQSLRTNKTAKIWRRSWKPSSQLSIVMPHRPLSPHVSRVFRRRVFVVLSW
jgi:hypothetical protein